MAQKAWTLLDVWNTLRSHEFPVPSPTPIFTQHVRECQTLLSGGLGSAKALDPKVTPLALLECATAVRC